MTKYIKLCTTAVSFIAKLFCYRVHTTYRKRPLSNRKNPDNTLKSCKSSALHMLPLTCHKDSEGQIHISYIG
jgi:hypothetical protein